MAGTFLHAVLAEDPAGSAGPVAPDGAERLTGLIRAWTERLRELCALLGVRTPAELTRTDVLVEGRLAHAAALRGADLAALAARSETTAFEEDRA